MNLDHDLRRAFRRTPAPAGLVDRVLARIEEPNRSSARNARAASHMPARRWLAAAAVLTLVAAGGARYYAYYQTAAEAERVKADIRLALQITSDKLSLVQRKVQNAQR